MSNISTATKTQQVIEFVKKRSMVRPRDLEKAGLPKMYLSQLARQGVLEKVGRGLYRWPMADISEHHSLVEVCRLAPKGVVAMLSALSFHQLTSQNPHKVWLAIDRKGWRPQIQYPPVQFITMSKALLEEGVELHRIGGVEVKVFSPAKTVVDCFKYRNKIGLDVALEALREGWREQRLTIKELQYFARSSRVSKVMQPYLESLAQ